MGKRTANTRRTNDPEGVRRRVLDVAAEAFQARGYHATSLHEVMAAAGVTGGALHHHFPTKKALALAVIEERVAAAVEATWIAPVRAAGSARDGILAVFADIADQLDRQRAVEGCPLNNLVLELSLADADFRAALHGVFKSWQAALADRLPQDQAAFVIAAYSGAMAQAKAAQDASPLRACARQLAALLPPG